MTLHGQDEWGLNEKNSKAYCGLKSVELQISNVKSGSKKRGIEIKLLRAKHQQWQA